MFSNIFEKQEDIKNCPFVFEKHNLKKRKTDEEYGDVKMASILIRPKKQSDLNQKPVVLNELNNDVENISVESSQPQDNDEPNFKQKYMMLVGHKLI